MSLKYNSFLIKGPANYYGLGSVVYPDMLGLNSNAILKKICKKLAQLPKKATC